MRRRRRGSAGTNAGEYSAADGPAVTVDDAALHVRRTALLQFGKRFGMPLPDLMLAVLYGAAAVIQFAPSLSGGWALHQVARLEEELGIGILVEGGFLFMQGTLVDLATRLKKRPPIWAIPLIAGALILFSPLSLDSFRMMFERGALVFVPFLLSLAERFAILWYMPSSDSITKVAARAQVSNRMLTALAGLAICTALMVLSMSTGFEFLGGGAITAAAAIYFAVAAFDGWRVQRPAFRANPRVLFRYDILGAKYLEPI